MFSSILSAIQSFVKSDKAAIVAGLVSVLGLLAAKFGLRLNGADTAYLAAILSAVVAAFSTAHFGKAAPPAPPAAPSEPAKPSA